MTDRGHRQVGHTADSAIEAWAPDVGGLFEECAAGMFGLVFVPVDVMPEPTIPVTASGTTVEELLVSWLSELLFRAEVDGLALCAFAVDTMTADRVEGRAGGPPAAEADQVGPPIKAVTYHGLAITNDDNWHATVIFDV